MPAQMKVDVTFKQVTISKLTQNIKKFCFATNWNGIKTELDKKPQLRWAIQIISQQATVIQRSQRHLKFVSIGETTTRQTCVASAVPFRAAENHQTSIRFYLSCKKLPW